MALPTNPLRLLGYLREKGAKIRCEWKAHGRLGKVDIKAMPEVMTPEIVELLQSRTEDFHALCSEIFAPLRDGRCPDSIKIKRRKDGLKGEWEENGQHVGRVFLRVRRGRRSRRQP